MAAGLAIHRLSARIPARAQPVAARLALQALSADLEDALPPGLPPQALLWLRRLRLQAPETALLRPAPGAWRQDWIAAGRERLDAALAQAARPALGAVPESAPAVLFADAAEMLACLALAAQAGQLDRWWWRGLLGHAWPHWETAWAARPEAQAGALRLLARVGQGGAVAGRYRVPEPARHATPAANDTVDDAGRLAGSRVAERLVPAMPEAAGTPARRAPAAVEVHTDAPRLHRPAPLLSEWVTSATAVPARVESPAKLGEEGPAAVPAVLLPAAPAGRAGPDGAGPHEASSTTSAAAGATWEPGPAVAPLPSSAAWHGASRGAVAAPPPRAYFDSLAAPAEPAPRKSPSGAASAPRASPAVPDAPAPSAPLGTEPERPAGYVAPRPPPVPLARAPAPPGPCALPALVEGVAAWPLPQAVSSRQAPLLFIVNVLLEDGLYPDFTRPRDPGLPVPLWALLAALARAWRLPADDPLHAALQQHCADWTAPDAMPAAPGAPAGPWPAWLAAYARTLRRRLCRRLGQRAAAWPQALTLARPARLWLSEAEWVAEFDLSAHDVAWRLAGLDRDPGWLPSAGCSLRFVFA